MGLGDFIKTLIPWGEDALEWGRQRQDVPQIGENPYMGQWGDLIGQLQTQSRGEGPSLSGEAYKQAHQTGMNSVRSMSRGGSAGAARQGMRQMGTMNQGLAQGYSNARLQEQLAARQQLQAALSGAGNAWFQPQQANLSAQLGSQTNMQQLTAILEQIGAIGGKIAGM